MSDYEDQFLRALGRVARESARQEYVFGALLAAVLNNPPATLYVAFGNPIGQTLDTLAAVMNGGGWVPSALAIGTNHADRIKDAVKAARPLIADRNAIIHATHTVSTYGPEVALYRARTLGRSTHRQWGARDVEALADRLTSHADLVRDLNNDVVGMTNPT